MQIPIINGIYTDTNSDFRTSYPTNLIPVPKRNGVSNGFLRPADGIVQLGSAVGPGVDRGGINWNDVCYRVSGSKLIRVDSDGTVTTIGDVGGSTTPVSMDYSFNQLGIASDDKLYYYDGVTLTQITDVDLGDCNDLVWVDGFFLSTDGSSVRSSQLNDPTQWLASKFESDIVDPDPIAGLLKLRNEAVVLNRHTIEFFTNVGGAGFPFARVDGAQLQRGCIGRHAKCVYNEYVAFLGGGRNESPSIWMGANGQTSKLSTHEIDQLLEEYTETELESVVLLNRRDGSHNYLWVVLPDRTLVYDSDASNALGQPAWFVLTTGPNAAGQYRATFPVWCYGKWIVGDPSSEYKIGYLTDSVSSHWGNKNGWEFQTGIVYNESTGAIFHDLELVALTGRTALGLDPRISTSYSTDGVTYSQERYIAAGKQGERNKRLRWLRQGHMRNWRIQRFKGNSDAHLSFARLEAKLEPLSV